jgi:hypothetical protein
MMAKSSLSVISDMKGRTNRGASVWPIKMLPEAEIDSEADVPRQIDRKYPGVVCKNRKQKVLA